MFYNHTNIDCASSSIRREVEAIHDYELEKRSSFKVKRKAIKIRYLIGKIKRELQKYKASS